MLRKADFELAAGESLFVDRREQTTAGEEGGAGVVAVPDAEDIQKRMMPENDIVFARFEKSKPAFTSKRWLGATPPPIE